MWIIVIIVVLIGYFVCKWVVNNQSPENRLMYLEDMRAGIINKLTNEIYMIETMSIGKSDEEINSAIKRYIEDFRRNAKANTGKMELIKMTSNEMLCNVIDSACDYVSSIYFFKS